MRWRWWWRRKRADSQIEDLERRVDVAQRKLDDTKAMDGEVRNRVRALEEIATRNNFAPMLRRALGGGHR